MNRFLPLIAGAGLLVLAACGGNASAAASTSPTPNRGAQPRNGATGQLVQINRQTLILTGANGDTVVAIGTSTTFTRTSVAALADVVPGACVVATGRKDASGVLTATAVRLAPKGGAGCGAGGFGQGPAGSPPPGASPRPSPPPGQAPAAFVAGEVSAASGTSVTVLTTGSGSQTIIIPTTAAITKSASATPSDLRTGECVRAMGAKDSAGTVQATSITISPAGPSGTCATGFGGGGRGPGRGGAAPTAAPVGD